MSPTKFIADTYGRRKVCWARVGTFRHCEVCGQVWASLVDSEASVDKCSTVWSKSGNGWGDEMHTEVAWLERLMNVGSLVSMSIEQLC